MPLSPRAKACSAVETLVSHVFTSSLPDVSAPPPVSPSRFYPPALEDVPTDISLQEQVNRLCAQVDTLRNKNITLATHGALVIHKLKQVKCQVIEAQDRPSKQCKLNVYAWCLTSMEGLAAAETQQREVEEKERKKQEAWEKRIEQEAEQARLQTERDPNKPFVGSLASKKKDELWDLAWALGLLENGTKVEITDRVNRYFDDKQLKTDHHYEGLFGSSHNCAHQ